MPERALRFGVHDELGRRGATWKLWTQVGSGRSEVYLASRALGGSLKISLHESGSWHIAYPQRVFEEKVRGAIPKARSRFVEQWSRPPDIWPGVALPLRIVTPWWALTNTIEVGRHQKVIWLPAPAHGLAKEIDIFISQPEATPGCGWPMSRSMGTSLIGSLGLDSKETVWAVCRDVTMPDIGGTRHGKLNFYKGVKLQDLRREGLRGLMVENHRDGSKILYDLSIKVQGRDD